MEKISKMSFARVTSINHSQKEDKPSYGSFLLLPLSFEKRCAILRVRNVGGLCMIQQPQAYDSSLKTLLEGLASQVLPELVSGVEVEAELNDEMLKPPLRADRVYTVLWRGVPCILHVELETKANANIACRLLEYNAILYKKHKKPVISVVIYPFRVKLPKAPLRIFVGSEEMHTFRYRVIALWKLRARSYLNRGVVGMYALLPTMRGATYELLKQALDEMKAFYGESRRRLAEQILLFDTFLQRLDTLSIVDKYKVQEYLDMFDSLLDESRIVKKKAAEAKAAGEVEGEIKALRRIIIELVQTRFPALAQLAQQKVMQLSEPRQFHGLVMQIALAHDEAAARDVLNV
jgi:hypothetical protein